MWDWHPYFAASSAAAPLAVGLALALDRAFGEPSARWHPVVGMGRYLACVGDRIAPSSSNPEKPRALPLALGALAWCVGAAGGGALAVLLTWAVNAWPWWAQAIALGVLLKPLLSWRMLRDEVLAVEAALGESLPAGRARLAWLVSRDVTHLSECEVRESAIETLAENLNDSVVAPLFWFAVAGLPGAAIYRFANTADAMWGYRGERNGRDWTWAGKWAARADDVLSWLPARITAAMLALPRAWARLRQLPAQARRTPSPNGGWPMAAMALALNVRLAKPGVYTLHAAGRHAQPTDTTQALRLSARVVRTWGLCAWALALVFIWRTYT
jgi:adenosylcobinamide-phosphate synthase